MAICLEPGAKDANEIDVKVFGLSEMVRGVIAPFSVNSFISTSARPKPLLTTLWGASLFVEVVTLSV